MAYMGVFSCQKDSSDPSSGGRGGGVAVGAVARRHCLPSSSIGKLMRKLKKRSKMLCMVTRPTTFHCQYDPLSYARNFDRNGFGSTSDDDSSHLYHTFSSRFAAISISMPREVVSDQ